VTYGPLPTMSEREVAFLISQLERATTFLEFGSGLSTTLAASIQSLKRIDVVENDPAFVEAHVSSNAGVALAVRENRLRFISIDIGPSGPWGVPKDRTRAHLWPVYSLLPFLYPREYDLILVDGRFRCACVCAAFLSNPGARVLVHDFFARARYQSLLKFATVRERVDTMALLGFRKGTKEEQLRAALRKFQYMPDDETLVRRLIGSVWRHVRDRK